MKRTFFVFSLILISMVSTAQTETKSKIDEVPAQEVRRNFSRQIVLADDDKPAFPPAPAGYGETSTPFNMFRKRWEPHGQP
jgi:hypothetical protein